MLIATHEFARTVEKDHPDRVVSIVRKELRQVKAFIDWSQNSPPKTTVAAYSLRARPDPTVSTPVTWEEVKHCAKTRDSNELRFEVDTVLQRVETMGDLLAPLVAKTTRK